MGLKKDGNYTCSDDSGDNNTVEVDVQYFHSSTHFTTATVHNSTTILTCRCYANPSCKIVPHIITTYREGQDNHDSVTTFTECKADPLREKQRKCTRVISVMHVYKEDNGKEMSCIFQI
ncbi:uncharacterized protein LOC132725570 [Ruditapes philippinarum]|uniref:uncharacterized protein LOC132725570 n=1 Tax=Ruditapes philippinarum TaxID=129788 RepID=UPI00295B34BB|nr:uncharacterized protein LOC132725570 [Ruditapes philippinarum]